MAIIVNEKQHANNAIVGCEYVFPSEIESEKCVGDSKLKVTLVAGKEWKSLYFTPGSVILSTQESIPFAGRIIESKFEMKVPGGSADLSAELIRICGRSIVLKLTYESGDVLICGGKNRKLKLVTTTLQGTTSGNVVGFTYQSRKDFMWLI